MHVTFGLYLDARQGPSPTHRFNQPVVGRLGFLSLLETYLGLAKPDVSSASRVAVYSGLLRAQDNGGRFYSESFQADSIGTAARLLAWRDEWRLGGWGGNAQPEHPLRLRELAAIEAAAAGTLPAGEAERLLLVKQALQATGPVPIKSLQLVDPLEDFPVLWRQVIELLPEVQVLPPSPQGTGSIRVVQEQALALIAGDALVKPDLPTDGSVQVIRSLSVTTAEHWLSAHQAHQPGDRLVLAEDAGDSLDVSLSATGGVNCGFESSSQLRPRSRHCHLDWNSAGRRLT